jgi:hypothetical protein
VATLKRTTETRIFFIVFLPHLTDACLLHVMARANSLYNGINVCRFTLLTEGPFTSVGQGSIYHPVVARATEYLSIHLRCTLTITVSSCNYRDFDQIQMREIV